MNNAAPATVEAAIHALGLVAMWLLALLALSIILQAFYRPGQRTFLSGLMGYALIFGLPAALAYLTFNPAIQAVGVINSPVMFALTGFFGAVGLAVLRNHYLLMYGLLEVLVAFVTLMALGQLYDATQPLTSLIAFVGAVYVMVRGFTNVGDGVQKARKG